MDIVSDSLLENMERKLNDLQARQKNETHFTAGSPLRRSASAVGPESTKKYSDLQTQMDQMLGMVRNESENVRNLESQLYSGASGVSAGAAPVRNSTIPKSNDPLSGHNNLSGRNFALNFPNSRDGSNDATPGFIATRGNSAVGKNPLDFEKHLSSLLSRSKSSSTWDSKDNAEVKSELEGVIAGLIDYLNHMRHELERLRKENERLKVQLAEQSHKVNDMENEKKILQDEKSELEKVQEKSKEIMLRLELTEKSNEDMKKELARYPDLTSLEQLKQSERDLHTTKNAISQMRDEFQAERDALNGQLKNERRKADDCQRKINDLEKVEKNNHQLQIQLASLQATKDSLKDQLTEMQKEYKMHVESALKPEDLLRHVQEMTLNAERLGGDVRPFHDNDLSGKALSDLQKVLNGKFADQKREMDNLKNLINSLQNDNKDLEDGFRLEQEKHRKSREQFQAQRNQDKLQYDEKIRQWQDEVKKVKDRSESDRDQYEQEMSKLESERKDLDKQLREMEKDHLKKELSEAEKFFKLQGEVTELKELVKSTNESHSAQIRNYEKTSAEYESKLNERERKCHELEKSYSNLEKDIAKWQLEIEQLRRQLVESNTKLADEQRMCEKHQDAIEQSRSEEARLRSVVKIQKDDIAKLSQLFEKALEGGVHNEELIKLTHEIGSLQSYIANQDETIRKLSEDLHKAELSSQQPRFIKDSESGNVLRTDDTNAGLYCSVLDHHRLEDYIVALKAKLHKATKHKSVDSNLRRQTKELDNVLSQLDGSKTELEKIDEQFKVVNKKYKATVERIEQFQKALFGITLNPEIIDYFNGKGNNLIPRDIAEALRKYDKMKNEALEVEDLLNDRKQELEMVEVKLKDGENRYVALEEKTKGVVKVYSETKKQLSKTQDRAKKLIEQMNVTSVELNHASSTLNTIKSEVEVLEKKKVETEHDLKDINKIIAKKNLEFQNIEQKRLRAKESADDIRSTEDELFGHLKASEKALIDRKNELQMLESQAVEETRHIEQIESELARKRMELQSVKDELSAKHAELTVVLKEAEEDMNKKSRELKDSKADLNNVQSEMTEYDSLRSQKRRELDDLRETISNEENNLTNLKDSISTSAKELKQIREMVLKEKSELSSIRNSHVDSISATTNFDF